MKSVSGHTTPYAVLGHPIGHSLSPVMHNASITALDLDAIYLAFDVAPERLLDVLPAMRDMGFGGVNLTVPLKEVAFNGLTELDATAQRVRAVNTVEFLPDGQIKGHNTDGDGFLTSLHEAFDISPEGRSVFVLGSGGAGRALALTCAAHGATRIGVADIDAERAERVAAELVEQAGPQLTVASVTAGGSECVNACREADIVIQSTPVGMRESDASPLPPDAFRAGQYVFDLVYMYPMTSLMSTAKQVGAKVENGLGMLLHQGARAFTIWSGQKPDVDAMRRALEAAVYS